jgi:glycerol-3-phosphate dehydrogenase
MLRAELLDRLFHTREPWDIVVIGGGATGVGIAVDAATRGYKVALVEQHDFGKGTSSRSTKLVHGGVRYLAQGNISLVREALHERGILRQNAPHLVHDLPFIIPCYRWWERTYYGIGLKLYQWLAGKLGFGPTRWLSRAETLRRLPGVQPEGLRGGVVYYDGQFDDARLLINLASTALEAGATVVNYVRAVKLVHDDAGELHGVMVQDQETGAQAELIARAVINATGPFCDEVRHLDDPTAPPLLARSQGAHIVLDRSFLPADSALMVPKTSDGRVMFAIPWHAHTLIGTTDVPHAGAPLEPVPLEQEIDFILETAQQYLAKKPTRADILAQFAGIRPLVRAGNAKNTSKLSRDHTIHFDPSGLVTITGGKWTTYRNMAQDCVNQVIKRVGIEQRPHFWGGHCKTEEYKIHGYHAESGKFGPLAVYGSDAPAIQLLTRQQPEWQTPLHPALPYTAAEVVWVTRAELARTIEDVLARRTRALFLNARAAVEIAPRVAELMGAELQRDQAWQAEQVRAFTETARGFLP